MNPSQSSPAVLTATRPRQVWETLTPSQQTLLLRTLVQVCQWLMTSQTQEQTNEPASLEPSRLD